MKLRRLTQFGLIAPGMLLLVACSKEQPAPTGASAPTVAVHQFDAASVARGASIFAEHCAQCHGPQAQGHPDWQTPSDGSFAAAPPLNGTGNEHNRTRATLASTIKNGVRRKTDNLEIMPSWKGRLSDTDVEDVLNWVQSLWPAEVYDAWTRAQVNAPKS
jgi:mono/diheme cytochrome c family protein